MYPKTRNEEKINFKKILREFPLVFNQTCKQKMAAQNNLWVKNKNRKIIVIPY